MVSTVFQRLALGVYRTWPSKAVPIVYMLLVVCMIKIPSAQAQSVITTRNAFVEADVSNDGRGFFVIYYFDGNGAKQHLTFDGASAGGTTTVTLFVDGTYYTNNTNVSIGTNWQTNANVPVTYLRGGITKKIQDTVQTVWTIGTNNFDIVQDIYPVASSNSGQIVYKWFIRNYKAVYLPAQAQLLLDVETSDASGGNDDPKVTTREGYIENSGQDYWHNFTTLPPYFVTCMYDICTKNFPGQLGVGYTVDSFASVPMGLMPPSLFANVDLVQYVTTSVWGYPTPYDGTPVSNDNAELFQWPGYGVGAGTISNPAVQELGCGSFGTPPCNLVCYGSLDAITLHVDHIQWTGTGYYPNHFPVEAVVWNSLTSSSARSAMGTQSIANANTGQQTGPIQIVSPQPVIAGGYVQTHPITSGGSKTPDSLINQCSASYITWEDTAIPGYLINCSTTEPFHIAFSISAAGVPNTTFISPPPNEGGCSCDITVDCQEKDVNPPRYTQHYSGSDSCHNMYICTIDSIFDDRSTDQGVQSVSYTVSPNTNDVKVTGMPPAGQISGCPQTYGPITITQTNMLVSPTVTFTFTDCAGNDTTDAIHFTACIPPSLIDTLPPKFWLKQKYNWNIPTDSSCGNKCTDVYVTDSVTDSPGLQKDLGLDSIVVVSDTNMSFMLDGPISKGMPSDSFTVCVNDSMQDGLVVIKARDMVGNIAYDTITYCTVADTVKPVVTVSALTIATPSTVIATDSEAWDRGVKQVMLSSVINCAPVRTPGLTIDTVDSATYIVTSNAQCPRVLSLQVAVVDSFKDACFTAQATDCAGNQSYPPSTTCYTALSDTYCPTIDTLTLPDGELQVTISDYHVIGGDTIGYDEGIDSVWFPYANNITLDSGGTFWQSAGGTLHTLHGKPTGSDHPKFGKIMQFTLFVTDTLSQDTNPPCFYVEGVDGAGNGLKLDGSSCGVEVKWCSNVAQDVNPPVLSVTVPACETVTGTATDDKLYDRGVYKVWLTNPVNFAPFADSIAGGQNSVPFTLQVPNPDQSSFGTLSSLDLYGHESPLPGVAGTHTTTGTLWLYKQDLGMAGSGIAQDNTTFKVPVFLVPTDTIPLAQKHLTQYQFQFHLVGNAPVTFVGTKLPATLPAGWTITPTPGTAPPGPPYIISGSGPALTNADASDTLVYLLFKAGSTIDVEVAQIAIDSEQCGADVLYNGGADTTVAAANFSATLPAPMGRLNGGTIILKDSCSTIIGEHPVPVILSLAPVKPNPANTAASVSYTVPAAREGSTTPIVLELYDAVGRKVRTIVEQDLKQGTYTAQIQTEGLAQGLYFLRLAGAGQACFEQVTIE